MSTELTLLALSAILCVLQAVPYTQAIAMQHGPAAAFGNREDLPPLTGWAGRAKRAHANMVENLIPFTALVVAAQGMGIHGGLTVTGAYLFFFGRLAHVIVYIAGITYVRTLCWAIATVGMALFVVAML